MRKRHSRVAEHFRNAPADPEDRDLLRVALRVYGNDGAVADRGSAFVRWLSRSRAVLDGFDLARQRLSLYPQLLGILFKPGPVGSVELAARALEFGFGVRGVVLIVEFFKCQDATLSLLRRTLDLRKKGPLSVPPGDRAPSRRR